MKKAPILIISFIVLLLISAALYVLGTGQSGTRTTPSTSPNTYQPAQPEQQPTEQKATNNDIDIRNFAFAPGNLTVRKGTTVKWTNYDMAAHTVTEGDGKTGPSSPVLNQNQSYSFTYDQAGTYAYKCSIHPNMTGTVIVTE